MPKRLIKIHITGMNCMMTHYMTIAVMAAVAAVMAAAPPIQLQWRPFGHCGGRYGHHDGQDHTRTTAPLAWLELMPQTSSANIFETQ